MANQAWAKGLRTTWQSARATRHIHTTPSIAAVGGRTDGVSYSLSFYRYPAAFFPAAGSTGARPESVRDDGRPRDAFLPRPPAPEDRPPAARGSVVDFRPASALQDDEEPDRQMMLRVTKYHQPPQGKAAGMVAPVTSFVVVSLDDSIGTLTRALQSLVAPHLSVRGLAINRAPLVARWLGVTRMEALPTDRGIRSLLRGPVHVEYDVAKGFVALPNGTLLPAMPPASSSDASTPAAAATSSTSSAGLPPLVFNSGRKPRLAELSLLGTYNRLLILTGLFVLISAASTLLLTSVDHEAEARKKLSQGQSMTDRLIGINWQERNSVKSRKNEIQQLLEDEEKAQPQK